MNKIKTDATNIRLKQNYSQQINTVVLSMINSKQFRPIAQEKLCGKCKNGDLKFGQIISGIYLCIRCQQRAEHFIRQQGGINAER